MDISILLNKTVTNLWDKTQVQQIKTITGALQALVATRPPVGPEEAGSQGRAQPGGGGGCCGHRVPGGDSGHQDRAWVSAPGGPGEEEQDATLGRLADLDQTPNHHLSLPPGLLRGQWTP